MTPWLELSARPVVEGRYRFVALRASDLEAIRCWRNAQIEVLRQTKPLSSEAQQHYYATVLQPLVQQSQPSQLLVSYLEDETALGYGGLTNIHWEAKRAEVSFLLNPALTHDPEIYESHFSRFLRLLSQLSFERLGFHRLFTETFAFRSQHIAILERAGFRMEGRLRDHIRHQSAYCDALMHGLLASEYKYLKLQGLIKSEACGPIRSC